MFKLGLTGGIGSGKTMIADAFAAKGVELVDADLIARQVVEPGSSGLKAIVEHFGAGVLSQGQLDRKALRQIIFSEPEQKAWLEALLHPLIRSRIESDLNRPTTQNSEQSNSNSPPYRILVSPLLFETQQDRLVDRCLLVDCSEEQQLQRTMARDGSDQALVEKIMASQMARQEKIARADDILDNSRDKAMSLQQLDALHQYYLTLNF